MAGDEEEEEGGCLLNSLLRIKNECKEEMEDSDLEELGRWSLRKMAIQLESS